MCLHVCVGVCWGLGGGGHEQVEKDVGSPTMIEEDASHPSMCVGFGFASGMCHCEVQCHHREIESRSTTGLGSLS